MTRLPFMRRNMDIAPLTLDDVEALHRLHAGAFFETWDENAFHNFLQDSTIFGLSARPIKEPNNMVAFVLARLVADEAEILSIAVDKEHRGDGIGQKLMHALLRHFYHHRVESAFLEVDENNIAAITLYKKFSFEEVGRRAGYYRSPDGRSDALILRRQLIYSPIEIKEKA
ncbi:ribosomal protein S18-alanine N-acetyltransferase [Bartonella sp. HY406]|uniref:ribosomal protein S18-alanine N-acetyltransferase n=1 Tax=Bartonella sp. HY406 TaxID=2979331 RepID=UPI0021C7ADFF|nr:ribosomal protein S18-alanine N-acetyltransferase [Bartonella sp. HY406]UXN03951.1 ribosomal protein S18-alanine N-acetyltransferase [Bartonella sp. HY406]